MKKEILEMLKNLHQIKMMDYAEAVSDVEKARSNGYLDAIDDVKAFVMDCDNGKERLGEIHGVARNEALKIIAETLMNKGKTKDFQDGYDKAVQHFMEIIVLLNKFILEDKHEDN